MCTLEFDKAGVGLALVRIGDKAEEKLCMCVPRRIWGLLLPQTSIRPIHRQPAHRVEVYCTSQVKCPHAVPPLPLWRRLKVVRACWACSYRARPQIPELPHHDLSPFLTITQLCLLKLARTTRKPSQLQPPPHRDHGDLYRRLLHAKRKFAAELGDIPATVLTLLQLLKYMSLDQKGSAMAE